VRWRERLIRSRCGRKQRTSNFCSIGGQTENSRQQHRRRCGAVDIRQRLPSSGLLTRHSNRALRRRQILQPVGGKGDKIFPPTYPEERRGAGPRHVFERRRIDGADVWCVLIDSV
jgi:hypothetical protein